MSYTWLDQLFRQFAQRGLRSVSDSLRSTKRRRGMQCRMILQLENLEGREVPAALVASPDYIDLSKTGTAKPNANPGLSGYIPSQILQAYGTNLVSFNGIQGNGAGTTIAIIDAYSDPTITTDLQAFDKEFDLPNPVFKVVNQTGGSTLPTANANWATEISLDVEWSHAIAPAANILLVEASSDSDVNLFTAARYAAKQPGVDVVLMSFGGSEFPGEIAYDSNTFSSNLNPGVVFVASSGDHGAPVGYPAISPDVLSVGGTSLTLTASGNYGSESAWSGPVGWSTSGGISLYESQPSYQQGVVTQSTTKRTNPDVAYDAAPATGFDVYETYGNSATKPWLVVGGTSDAAPQWAGLIAITDQGLALDGEAPLNNATLMPELYSLPTTLTEPASEADFHDITTGSSTGTPHYPATKGYDLATGLGTPIVNNLIPALIAGTGATQFTISAPTTTNLGNSFNITITALNADNQPDPGYTGTVSFASSDGLADLPAEYTFTSADEGSHTFTVTMNTLGNQTITVTDNNGVTGTTSVDVETGYSFSISGFPSSVTAGDSENFTVTAMAADGIELTSYSGTVLITSSDPAMLPFDVTVTNGVGTSSATLTTAGLQSLTATDSIDSTMTGSEMGILVTPAAASQLSFIQNPSNDNLGSPIDPAVIVAELDPYGNIVTTDSSDQVTLTLGSNSGGAVLSGGGPITVTNGVATFSNLSVSALGTGYTLIASSNGLTGTTSTPFNVLYSPLLENFTNGLSAYNQAGSAARKVATTAAAAHPGTATLGLSDGGDENWYYRTDAAGQVNPGDTISVWVQFSGAASGRAYFGFGSTSSGTLSVVLAPNTSQLLIQNNAGYDTYTNLVATSQTYSYNTWYLVQVQWGTSGTVVANLFASNGTTLVNSVTVATGDTTPGDFAFRAVGATIYYSTVSVSRGVNNFSVVNSSNLTQSSAVVGSGTQSLIAALAPTLSSTQSVGEGTTWIFQLSDVLAMKALTTADLTLLQSLEHSAGTAVESKSEPILAPNGQEVRISVDDGLLFLEVIS